MNERQRGVIVITLLVLLALAVVPPWVKVVRAGIIYQETPASFLPIFAPPQPTNPLESYRIDTERLLVLWSVVAISASVLFLVLRSHVDVIARIAPRTFAEVFGSATLVAGGWLTGLMYLTKPDVRAGGLDSATALLSWTVPVGVAMGVVLAYFYKGEVVVRESENLDTYFEKIASVLGHHQYQLEGETGKVQTYKAPFLFSFGGPVYVQRGRRRLRVVGPSFLLKKL